MCFYFGVHVKSVLKLVVICWNALLSTPEKTSIKEDADLFLYCLLWVLALMLQGFSDDWSWEGSWLITCLDWIYRLVDTCCLFCSHSRGTAHTPAAALLVILHQPCTSSFTASALDDSKILTVISILCILGFFFFFKHVSLSMQMCSDAFKASLCTLH